MFSKYPRHLFFRFVNLLILSLGCVVSVFLVIDFVENTKSWIDVPQEKVIEYYIHTIPYIVYLTLPIALTIAAVFSVGLASKHLELVTMRALGNSLHKVLFPILIFGVLISVGMFYFGNTILPDSNHKRFVIKEPKAPENKRQNPKEKYRFVFIGPEGVTYFFERYSGTAKRGTKVTLLQENNDTLYRRYDANIMEWKNNRWKMKKGIRRDFFREKVIATAFDSVWLDHIKDEPEDFVNNRIFPDEMSLEVLEERIAVLRRSGESTTRLETQKHFKIASCAVGFIMVIFGISLAAHSIRSGLTIKFGIALLVVILYFISLRMGLIMGENGAVSPMVGAWLANFVFGAVGLILFLRIGRS